MTPAELPDVVALAGGNERLAKFLGEIAGREDFPVLVRNVESISEAVLDPQSRVQLLNQAIDGDAQLSQKVLHIANSAIYAAAGRTVSSVYQAIMLLGFARMKDIAVGAAIFEHLKGRSPHLRELMACSVITANTALVLCDRTGYERAETAYLTGIFRNLGELVCATYRPRDYGTYKEMPHGEDDPGRTAELEVFGFRFDELGQAIAKMWGLPESISDAMYRPPDISPGRGDGPGTLAAITQLAADLTNAIYRSPAYEQRARVLDTLARYGKGFGLDEQAALDAARNALEESTPALRTVNAGVDPLGFSERLAVIRHAVLGPDAGTATDAPAPRITTGTLLGSGDHGAVSPIGADFVFGDAPPQELPAPTIAECQASVHEMREAVLGARPMGTDEAVARTLATLLALGFQRAALLVGADGHTRLQVRMQLGEGSEYLGDGLRLTLVPPNGPLALAVVRKELIFGDQGPGSPWRGDPSLRRLRSVSYAMLPVVVGGQVIGALFADVLRRPLVFDEAFREPVVAVRDTLQQAFERLRQLAKARQAGADAIG